MVLYWVVVGTIKLAILTYQDLFNKMIVDDRYNYFMMGSSMALIMVYDVRWWYFLNLLVIGLIFSFLFIKYGKIGSGDIKTLLWIFIGFGIISWVILVIFVCLLAGMLLVSWLSYYICIKLNLINQETEGFPAYPAIFGSFILTFITFNQFI